MNVDQIIAHIQNQDVEEALLYLIDNCEGGRASGQALFDKFGNKYTWELVSELERLGLAEARSLGGTFELTGRAEAVAERIKASITGGARRDGLVRCEALKAVANSHDAVAAEQVVELAVGLDPVPSQEEAEAALDWLADRQMIEVTKDWQGMKFAHALTPRGRDALRSDDPLLSKPSGTHAYYDNRGHVNVGGNVTGGVQGGMYNTQTVMLSPEETKVLADSLRRALDHAREAGNPEVETSIEQAVEVLESPHPDRSVIRGFVNRALGAAVTTMGTQAGTGAVQFLLQTLPLLS